MVVGLTLRKGVAQPVREKSEESPEQNDVRAFDGVAFEPADRVAGQPCPFGQRVEGEVRPITEKSQPRSQTCTLLGWNRCWSEYN